ncbi:MAG: hypothetical protein IKU01_00615 [Bacteroidales bacterium]|nr:hypothetical protein [Bacteroidales bacterium]
MKKLTLSIVLLAAALLGNNNCLNAQNKDAFFDSKASNSSKAYRQESDVVTPLLPAVNTYEDQGAPLGSGLLVLTGLGLGYIALRKKD